MLPVLLAGLLICAPRQLRAEQPAEPTPNNGIAADFPADSPAHFLAATAVEPKLNSSGDWIGETGVASFYGRAHQGKRTAGGSRFNQMALTAAHPWLPFGTKILVTVQRTGREVVVTITDRLPSGRRAIDVSLAAARALGFVGQGLAAVSLVSFSPVSFAAR